MGSKSRQEILGTTGLFHKMQKGHNSEKIYSTKAEKDAYLKLLFEKLTPEIAEEMAVNSFCVMNNHAHELGQCGVNMKKKFRIREGIKTLGNFMRNVNSVYATRYNKSRDRSGSVQNSRPKTVEIKNPRSVLNVMMYIDANPVKAGIVTSPEKYRWSSYNYYAYGKTNEHTEKLAEPEAYTQLGKTRAQRQRRYRRMMLYYLRRLGLLKDIPADDEGADDLDRFDNIFALIDELIREASLKTVIKPG